MTITTVPASESRDVTNQEAIKVPRVHDRRSFELVFALVGPIGSGCTTAYSLVSDILKNDYGYDEVYYYKLSDFITTCAHLVNPRIDVPVEAAGRIKNLQSIGDRLRKRYGSSYLAAKTVEKIALRREKEGFGETQAGERVPKQLRVAHIIDSLKHPEELDLLRSTYGEIFWSIGIFAPLSERKKRLQYRRGVQANQIEEIVLRDYVEVDDDYGQNVRDVFYQSDFFIRNDQENTDQFKGILSRFIDIIFGCPVHTPTIDESAMYAAHAEATKSACLSRQVGAAITNNAGELIGLGRNDVPRFGGGLYTEDDDNCDHRCHKWATKECHNDKKKNALYQQVYDQLSTSGLLVKGALLETITGALKLTDIKSLIEYSRAVHAEMDAITSVARLHKPGLVGGMLYSTTFPCHSCARHIVASGIHKVYFIEPYPKSLATELHSDSISENENEGKTKVLFLQYSGIAPKNILKLFNSTTKRKDKISGKVIPFNKKKAIPIVTVSLDDYATHEKYVVAELAENERQAKATDQTTLFGS